MYLRLLGAPRRLRAGRLELRVLTAFEMLQARAEAALTADGDEAAFGLWLNAAVLARAVHVRGRRPFRSAVDAAGTLSPAQIETLTESYELLCKRDNLSPCADAQTHEELLRQLAGRPYERLKWRVLRAFSTLPSSRAARAMTDADYLYCALHTVLDGREYRASLCPGCRERLNRPVCPGCGAELSEEMVNASFDEAAFERRRRGIC